MITRFDREYKFLSNFWPSEVTVLVGDVHVVCPTVEHGYNALKSQVAAEQIAVIAQPTPGKAKRAGRKVALRTDWDQVKVGVMKNLLRLKFAPGTELALQLLATGDEELVEGNDWGDLFWGRDLRTGQGLNMLGKSLMQIRQELRLGEPLSFAAPSDGRE